MLLPTDVRSSSDTPLLPRRGRHVEERVDTAVPVTPDNFCGWLAMAMPGDTTVYYHGHLGRDRCRSTSALSESDRLRLIALARQALLAAEDGRVHLVQRRHGDSNYTYVAIKTRHRGGNYSYIPTLALSRSLTAQRRTSAGR